MGENISHSNNVGDSIVDGSSAIPKTIRIQVASFGGKPEFNFGRDVLAMQENSSGSKPPEAEAVVNENFQKILKSGTDQIT